MTICGYGWYDKYVHQRQGKVSDVFADMVELADTPDLGSGGRPCRFESCYPHEDMVFRVKKRMEMMENRMESGFLKIEGSLEALIFCWKKCR